MTTTVDGANTYTGPTYIYDSVIVAGHDQALSTSMVLIRGSRSVLRASKNIALANEISFSDPNRGSLTLDASHDLTLTGNIYDYTDPHIGGKIVKTGDGTLTLAGQSEHRGETTIQGGVLIVDGSIERSSQVTVQQDATLGGSGTVGKTTIEDGGILAPGGGAVGTLTVSGDLTLSPGSILEYQLGSPGTAGDPALGRSDRVIVAGALQLDGTLNLANSGDASDGTAGLGYYRLMTYGGALTDNGLDIGSVPLGDAGRYEIQAGSGRVDLFVPASPTPGDDTLQHWQGGDGTWNAANANWLNIGVDDAPGNLPVAWAGNHAVFKNQPGGFNGGVVNVEGAHSFKGLQFVDDGYRLQGDGSLETDAGGSEIRVLADRAEIATEITGAGGLAKTEGGTLVLSGANSYTGGTTIENGTIRAGAAGAVQGDYVIGAGGTLDIAGQSVTLTSLAGEGEILFAPSGAPTLTIDQADETVFSGAFSVNHMFPSSLITLNKRGTGTLTLTGESSPNLSGSAGFFSLGVSGGTLAIEDGGSLRYSGSTVIGGDAGVLRVAGTDTRWHSGMLSLGDGGPGSLNLQDHAEAWTRTFATIGSNADGTARLSNGADWRQDGGLTIGQGTATGRLIIERGSTMTTGGAATLGAGADARGEVVVSDAQWLVNGRNILVGDNGKASLDIRDGGVVEVGRPAGNDGLIGYGSDAEGSVSVDGTGSRWSLGTLVVGYQGLGTLELSNRGKVESGSSFLGDGSLGEGVAAVRGDDTQWSTRDLTIGRAGKGKVIVADGGTLDTGFFGIVVAQASNSQGTLQIGEGGRPGHIAGSGARITFGDGDGTLLFDHNDDAYLFDTSLSSAGEGRGAIVHQSGTTTLAADNSGFTGATRVAGGTMRVENVLGGSATVGHGGALGGSGTVGSGAGSVVAIEDGGTLAPGRGANGTLAVNGDLVLSSGSFVEYRLGAPGVAGDPGLGRSNRVAINGDLLLDGTLNLRRSGDPLDGKADLGYYRLMTYAGNLTDQGLQVGVVPHADASLYEVRADNGHVDLFVPASGMVGDDTLQHWQGGDGVWNAANLQWLNKDGELPVAWVGNHAVFRNQPGGFDGGAIDIESTQRFAGLQIVDEGYRLQGAGALETIGGAGSEIRVLADRAEIATQITGVGGITKTEAGTLVLSGANSYRGGTTFSDGVVSVSSDANLGQEDGVLTFDGGVLQVTGTDFNDTERQIAWGARGGGFDIANEANNFYVGQNIVGPGDLVKRGDGALTLAGENAYGSTRVEAGQVLGNAKSISGSIANAGVVAFIEDGDARFAGDITGLGDNEGTMVKEGAGTLTLEGRSLLDWSVASGTLMTEASRFEGNAHLGGTAGGLTFIDANNAVYGGVISGVGQFSFEGAGTVRLTGDSSHFAGTTVLSNGTLLVGDAEGNGVLGGSLDVLAGATLGGSGTVGAGAGSRVTVASGGILAPGNSIGTLGIDGDLTFEAGSRFEVEVDPQGSASDRVAVTGNATLHGGAVVHVGADGNYDLRSTYTILTVGGVLSGAFDEVSSDFAFLTPDLNYDYGAGTVELELARNDRGFASVALTRNQNATANGIESIGIAAGHAVYDAIAQLPDDEKPIRDSFDALSGEIHASAKSALIEDSRFVRNAANDRVRAAFGAPGASTAPVQAYGPTQAPAQVSASNSGPVVWSQAFGSWGSTDSDGNAAGMDRDTGGLLIGADRQVGDWRVGLLAGYSRSNFKARDRASSAKSNNYHLGLYGGTQWDALGLRAGLAYTWHDVDTKRSVSLPGLRDSAGTRYHAGTLQVFGELGYGIDAGAVRFEPYASLAHVHLHTDGYGERGGAAALSGRSGNTDVTFSTLGLRAEHRLSVGATDATLRAAVGWRHAFGDTTPTTRHVFSAGDAFTVAGVPIAKNGAIVEAGVDLNLTPNATFGFSYAGQLAGSSQDHGVKANLAIRF